jgi:hypothetical protein
MLTLLIFEVADAVATLTAVGVLARALLTR